MKYRSKNVGRRGLTVRFVNFKGKLSPIVRKLTTLTLDTKHFEESRPDFMKNWRNEKEHFEKLIQEIFMKWKN